MKSTNRRFAKENKLFQKACELTGIPATSRQASKYRRNLGLAVNQKEMAKLEMEFERRKK